MTRKRKAGLEAEKPEFLQQTSKFKDTKIRRANFHTVTDTGTPVNTSILAPVKTYESYQPGASLPSGPLSSDAEPILDDAKANNMQSQASAKVKRLLGF